MSREKESTIHESLPSQCSQLKSGTEAADDLIPCHHATQQASLRERRCRDKEDLEKLLKEITL
jgi:hypothetical protein